MRAGGGVEEGVRELVRARAPRAAEHAELADALPLGSGGLGLDSIALVELLVDCERRFGMPAATTLLAGEPLTVGRLVEHLRAAAPR